ncbi:hypothetical protein EV356DRAFT_529223 [Viridothelium virens]|uniref:Uncharacterized protein n=1 Tax=Viridothelium virens TaxID=1048519 RepID=A0A6A6HK10_VIRVR|nr:hypothetical protein EV356DRAFT_529223 [Viridothelium virens]
MASRDKRRNHGFPWLKSRCFVYDCESVKLEVCNEKTVAESRGFQKISLKPRQRHVTLFMTPEEGNAELKTEGGNNNLLFATLDLEGEGLIDKLHMMTGGLRTLYVSQGKETAYLGEQGALVHAGS